MSATGGVHTAAIRQKKRIGENKHTNKQTTIRIVYTKNKMSNEDIVQANSLQVLKTLLPTVGKKCFLQIVSK